MLHCANSASASSWAKALTWRELVYTFKRKSDGKDVKYCQVIKNIFNL